MAKAQTATAGAIRGIHVFWWISGFFAVIIALDALFITFALQTFPGEQVRNSYMLGLDYNSEVARRREQEKLGWTAEAGISGAGEKQILVRMLDAGQAPLSGLVVSANLHVVGEPDATTVALKELSPGEYATTLTMHANARVEAIISARRAGSDVVVFTAVKTLVMP